MRSLFFGLLMCLITVSLAIGQGTDTDNTISVNASGEVQMPADQLQLSINVNAEADTPQAAFDRHQDLEDKLVGLLEEFEFSKEDIRFQPMSINHYSRRDRNEEQDRYQTSQQVRLTIDDFKIYEKMQLRLIEGGFDQFNGQFTTTQHEEGEEKAIRKAMANARKQAKILASEAGVKLGNVLSISQGGAHVIGQPRMMSAEMAVRSDKSMFEYDQTVTIRADVSVRYLIVH